MMKVILDKEELKLRVYSIFTSAIRINGKKINYREFILSLENEDCNTASKRIAPRIIMKK